MKLFLGECNGIELSKKRIFFEDIEKIDLIIVFQETKAQDDGSLVPSNHLEPSAFILIQPFKRLFWTAISSRKKFKKHT